MENRGQDHSAEEAQLVQMFANATSCDRGVVGGLARISELKQLYARSSSGPKLNNFMNMKKRAIFVWMSKFQKVNNKANGQKDFYSLSENLGDLANVGVKSVTIDAKTFNLERDQETNHKTQAQKATISRPMIHSFITTQECMTSVRHLSTLHQTQSKKGDIPLYPLWVVVKLLCNMKLGVIGTDVARAETGRPEPTGTTSKVGAQPKKKQAGSKRSKSAASSTRKRSKAAASSTR